MRFVRAVALFASVGASASVLVGCSLDALVWGGDGARVIDTTEQLIDEVAERGESTLLCGDADVRLGTRADWRGRSAGEPERFTGRYWADKVPLNPQWSINLEGLPDGAAGDQFPGDVFYREHGDGGLCVIDISWSTLEPEG